MKSVVYEAQGWQLKKIFETPLFDSTTQAQGRQLVTRWKISLGKVVPKEIAVQRCVEGASQCEADASVSQGLSVSVRLGEVDTVEYQRDRGLAVTVYFGKRKGSASGYGVPPSIIRSDLAHVGTHPVSTGECAS